MTLVQVLKAAQAAGYTHATDMYSYRGRKIKNWLPEAEDDDGDYVFDVKAGIAKQNHPFPSNEWHFWTKPC